MSCMTCPIPSEERRHLTTPIDWAVRYAKGTKAEVVGFISPEQSHPWNHVHGVVVRLNDDHRRRDRGQFAVYVLHTIHGYGYYEATSTRMAYADFYDDYADAFEGAQRRVERGA